MGRLFKYLFYLVILAAISLSAYAYVGPWFGANFDAPVSELRVPVVLDVN